MIIGTQIAYIPNHADGNAEHPDVEFGFVTSARGDCHFCRYWRKNHLGELRTLANSELAPNENLIEFEAVPQQVVVNWIRKLRIN